MGVTRAKVFTCDGCDKSENVASNYRKQAPPGWLHRDTAMGKVVACSAECTEKVDAEYRPAWLRVPASDAG